ncbi:MAG: glycoside hydrolase family 57 protein [Planctomycetota bacterium]|nr:glycoside hydrolase family 57 protein [Planctomycetota bacterium]MDA0934913.1 glycoside hydrolase family 57 protein [Planctomycetota bacterium]MDA1221414.1 glycoside hydrolase family 57 protein [Planctomycetota bacterium]
MTDVVFWFEAHQPFRLRHASRDEHASAEHPFDDAGNRFILERVAERCYRPMNRLLLDLIEIHEGRFRCSFSLTGTLIEQLREWEPKTLDLFVDLAKTGCVEFVCETSHHTLAALTDPAEFAAQVSAQRDLVEDLFGTRPTTFRNTELILDESVAAQVEALGFDALLGEGAAPLLGDRQPFWPYRPRGCERLKLLLRCYPLSDDIGFRFSNPSWPEYPLMADRYARWLKGLPEDAAFVGLFMDYETFGEHQWIDTGIFDFMRRLPQEALLGDRVRFATPSQVAEAHPAREELPIPRPISWADEERDLSAWLANPMQRDAHDALYALLPSALAAAERGDPGPMAIWRRLSTSDHVYYMATKRASDGDVHDYFSPYPRPHDAYMNFMNALEALRARLERPRVEPTTPAGSPAQPRSTSSRKPGGRRGGRRRR